MFQEKPSSQPGKMDQPEARQATGMDVPENCYRHIIETAQEGIWILDTGLRTTYVNTCMANMLGTTVDAMYQKPFEGFLFADDAKVASYISNFNTANEPIDCRFQQADGSARWARVSATQVKDDSGNLVGYVTMHIDLTYQKKTEDAL